MPATDPDVRPAVITHAQRQWLVYRGTQSSIVKCSTLRWGNVNLDSLSDIFHKFSVLMHAPQIVIIH